MPDVSALVICRDALETAEGAVLWKTFVRTKGPLRRLWAYVEFLWHEREGDCQYAFQIEDSTGRIIASTAVNLLLKNNVRQAVLQDLEMSRALTSGQYFCTLVVDGKLRDGKLFEVS